jgi:DNA-directed RNA polymerase specialized sigma24 family protein
MAHRRTRDTDSMTAAGFERLLRRFDADPARAAAGYEQLRLTLVKFFDWRGAWAPDECADETLDRLAAKLEIDTAIDDVRRYAHGIARLVLLERLRQQAQMPVAEHPNLTNLRATPADASSPLHDCFERCLEALPRDSRTLVVQYYVAEGQTKIDNRQRLARSLGISENALRSRVQRLRDRLERCASTCAAQAEVLGLEAALRHVTLVPDTVEMKAPDGD